MPSITAPRPRVPRLLVLIIGALIVGSASSALAATPPALEACFLDRINEARATSSIEPLVLSGDLSVYGRDHSIEMAGAGSLYHSSQDDLDLQLPDGWRAWGENVGYATGSEDCDWLFEGFWDSPGHRDNLMNPIFDAVGIGVYVDPTDTMWTTHVFVQNGSPEPPPTTTTTTTTTVANTTSTTQAPAATTTSTTTSVPTITSTTEVGADQESPTTTASPPTSSANHSDAVSTETTASVTTAVPASIGDAPAAPDSTPSPTAAPPLIASAGSACATDCESGTGYVTFLLVVALCGGAISWWAFRG